MPIEDELGRARRPVPGHWILTLMIVREGIVVRAPPRVLSKPARVGSVPKFWSFALRVARPRDLAVGSGMAG